MTFFSKFYRKHTSAWTLTNRLGDNTNPLIFRQTHVPSQWAEQQAPRHCMTLHQLWIQRCSFQHHPQCHNMGSDSFGDRKYIHLAFMFQTRLKVLNEKQSIYLYISTTGLSIVLPNRSKIYEKLWLGNLWPMLSASSPNMRSPSRKAIAAGVFLSDSLFNAISIGTPGDTTPTYINWQTLLLTGHISFIQYIWHTLNHSLPKSIDITAAPLEYLIVQMKNTKIAQPIRNIFHLIGLLENGISFVYRLFFNIISVYPTLNKP